MPATYIAANFRYDSSEDYCRYIKQHGTIKSAQEACDFLGGVSASKLDFDQAIQGAKVAQYHKLQLHTTGEVLAPVCESCNGSPAFNVLLRHVSAASVRSEIWQAFWRPLRSSLARRGVFLAHFETALTDLQRVAYLAELGFYFKSSERSAKQRQACDDRNQLISAAQPQLDKERLNPPNPVPSFIEPLSPVASGALQLLLNEANWGLAQFGTRAIIDIFQLRHSIAQHIPIAVSWSAALSTQSELANQEDKSRQKRLKLGSNNSFKITKAAS